MLISYKLNGGVREDTQECCRMTTKQASHAILAVDVSHGSHDSKPRAGVLSELRAGGLKEDLDAIEGADYCFGLDEINKDGAVVWTWFLQHILPNHPPGPS